MKIRILNSNGKTTSHPVYGIMAKWDLKVSDDMHRWLYENIDGKDVVDSSQLLKLKVDELSKTGGEYYGVAIDLLKSSISHRGKWKVEPCKDEI